MGKKVIELPGAVVAGQTGDDAFQAVADRINKRVRDVVADELTRLSRFGVEPEDGSGFGPTVVAAVAAMLNAAGYLTASFEPHVRGDVMSGVAQSQFDAGREDYRLHHRSTVQ
jgi:hypothetical protein